MAEGEWMDSKNNTKSNGLGVANEEKEKEKGTIKSSLEESEQLESDSEEDADDQGEDSMERDLNRSKNDEDTDNGETVEKDKKDQEQNKGVKRRRGRPPKKQTKNSDEHSPVMPAEMKRRRGRPRKNSNSEGEINSPQKKKEQKSSSAGEGEGESNTNKRPVGRPRKRAKVDNDNEEKKGEKSNESASKGKRGRHPANELPVPDGWTIEGPFKVGASDKWYWHPPGNSPNDTRIFSTYLAAKKYWEQSNEIPVLGSRPSLWQGDKRKVWRQNCS